MSFEMIENLCQMHTQLTAEDIQCIKQMAVSLPGLVSGSESGVDFFIDCPCRGSSEAVVVAQESAQPSLYDISTVGYIIQEDAELRSAPLSAEELARRPYLRNVDWPAGCIHDAVIITDGQGIVRYRNGEAARIYRDYGYINDILGMEYRRAACHGELPAGYGGETVISIRGSFYRIEQRLRTAMNRIISVASVYDVSGTDAPDKVSLFQTLLQLREHFNQMTAMDGRSLNTTVQGMDLSVNTEVSTVIALVVNELLQNAYKYAFPGRRDGNIHIELNNGSLYPLLTVADDGVGFDVSRTEGAGMGYRIIHMLVQNNLGSQLDVQSGPEGTRVTFGFRLK